MRDHKEIVGASAGRSQNKVPISKQAHNNIANGGYDDGDHESHDVANDVAAFVTVTTTDGVVGLIVAIVISAAVGNAFYLYRYYCQC